MRTATVLTLASLMTLPAAANVIEGDTAPMIVSVDERMRAFDMADLVDGAPLVFLYGSAT
jgi:hypothetical protein